MPNYELNRKIQIGENKFIEPISLELKTPIGTKYFTCLMHREDGRITQNVYASYHIEILVKRFKRNGIMCVKTIEQDDTSLFDNLLDDKIKQATT